MLHQGLLPTARSNTGEWLLLVLHSRSCCFRHTYYRGQSRSSPYVLTEGLISAGSLPLRDISWQLKWEINQGVQGLFTRVIKGAVGDEDSTAVYAVPYEPVDALHPED